MKKIFLEIIIKLYILILLITDRLFKLLSYNKFLTAIHDKIEEK